MAADERRPYGEGSVTRRTDGRFHVRVSVDGEVIHRYADTEAEAEKIRRHLVRRKRAGKLKPDPPRLRVDELLDKWLATKEPPEVEARSLVAYRRRLKLHVRPFLGRSYIADLTPLAVQDWLRALVKAKLSTTTIAQARALLSEALEWAVDLELLDRNPARRIRTPRGKAPVVRTPPARDDARAFLAAAADHRLSALWHLAAYLGLRRGELLGLTWAAVDLDKKALRVEAQLIREDGEWTLPDPKSEAGNRTLPLVDPLPGLLARRRREQIEERLRAPEWGPDRDLVFTTPAGLPLEPATVRQAQRRLAQAAELADISLHRYRHNVSTWLLEMGAPDRISRAFLGHATRDVSGRYQHVGVEMLRPYAERIAERWEDTARNVTGVEQESDASGK